MNLELHVNQALETRNFRPVLELCEETEIEGRVTEASANLFSVQLVALVIVDYDLNECGHLWKRIPQVIKESSPELVAIASLVRALDVADPSEFYQQSQTQSWSPVIKRIVDELVQVVRNRWAVLIASAYSAITVQTCSRMLGLCAEAATADVVARGWSVDKTQPDVLRPVDTSAVSLLADENTVTGATMREHIQKLVQYISTLDQDDNIPIPDVQDILEKSESKSILEERHQLRRDGKH